MVSAWDANDSYVVVVPERPTQIEGVLNLLDMASETHLIRWGLVSQRPVSRSVESCCVIPVKGKDVTVEDGPDSPAEPPVFNPPGHSDPVD
ncbi:MAG: hypothetical protein ABIP43_03885 [Nitrospiraceae bacterium]